MKQTIIGFVLVLGLVVAAAAHGKAEKSMGTVKSISTTELVITTTAGLEKAFQLTANTRFLKSEEPAKVTDLIVGDRVVVEADVHHGSKAIAISVKFGKPAHTHNH